MILVTTVATALIGAQGAVGLMQMAWLLLGTGLVAASAGAANQIWERVIDQQMTRTARRPLPAGRYERQLRQSSTRPLLGIAGTAILYWTFSVVPAAVGLATWLLVRVGLHSDEDAHRLEYDGRCDRRSDSHVDRIHRDRWIAFRRDRMVVGGRLGCLAVPTFHGDCLALSSPVRRRPVFRCRRRSIPAGRSAAIQSIAGSLALIACAIALCWIPAGWKGATVATLGDLVERMADVARFATDSPVIPSDTLGSGPAAKVFVGTARGVRHRHRAIVLVSQRVKDPRPASSPAASLSGERCPSPLWRSGCPVGRELASWRWRDRCRFSVPTAAARPRCFDCFAP